MDNFNEGGIIHRSNINFPPKNRDKGNYEDRVECNSEENFRFNKIFNKVLRKHDKKSGNNVCTNVKKIQHKENDGEIKNINYSYNMCKGIQCLNSQVFQENKEKTLMLLMMKKVNLTKQTML